MSNTQSKKLLVIGATSFVGRRFCRYLIESDSIMKWNYFFARNKNKFEKIFSNSVIPESIKFNLLDTYEAKDVDHLVSQNNIVCNFAAHLQSTRQMLLRCAKHGVHYLDITGEINFIRDMINKYESAPKQLVHQSFLFVVLIASQVILPFLIKNKISRLHNEKIQNVHTIFNVVE